MVNDRKDSVYAKLVETANSQRFTDLETGVIELSEGYNLGNRDPLETLERELAAACKAITIKDEEISTASKDYEVISKHLTEQLRWPNDVIEIKTQGSARSQTLIQPLARKEFDIDAVCVVDITRVEGFEPMRFFEAIGGALRKWKPDRKKRCWRINLNERTYYIEFTPSVPLDKASREMRESIRFKPRAIYRETALAVVDTPSQKWKTSNPEGLVNWLDDQAQRVMLRRVVEFTEAAARKDISVEPVPDQEVPLHDTLRSAIRLFKRHRDVLVQKGVLTDENKPISIVIVTLLTQCYEGLADLEKKFDHPIQLLAGLAQLVPGMIETRGNQLWVANPTVEGENFAEKWNDDGGLRQKGFRTWCQRLNGDLKSIIEAPNEMETRKRIRTIFALPLPSSSNTPPSSGSGFAPSRPTKSLTPQPTQGLA